jgi:hypothetical protein
VFLLMSCLRIQVGKEKMSWKMPSTTSLLRFHASCEELNVRHPPQSTG